MIDIDFVTIYWLFFMPLPWLWFLWRLGHSEPWPRMLPVLSMRYPLLNDLSSTKQAEESNIKVSLTRDRIMAIALSFMVIALAQPVRYSSNFEQEQQTEPVDLIIVVDTALSMSLRDYQMKGQVVSRLGLSQLLLKKFIQDYSGSRIGLVLQGNPPALWLPLTTDKAVVQDAVSRITTLLGGRLSDMGATLNLIRDNYKDKDKDKDKDKQEKVIILVSDGGTQIGSVSPEKAVQDLAEEGFTLYVIAVGSSDTQAKSLDNSSLIYEAVNLKSLQTVAEYGNGKLFHVLDSQAFSNALIDIQSKHRKPVVPDEPIKLKEEWYSVPLSIALLLIFYAAFMHNKYSITVDNRGQKDV